MQSNGKLLCLLTVPISQFPYVFGILHLVFNKSDLRLCQIYGPVTGTVDVRLVSFLSNFLSSLSSSKITYLVFELFAEASSDLSLPASHKFLLSFLLPYEWSFATPLTIIDRERNFWGGADSTGVLFKWFPSCFKLLLVIWRTCWIW